MPKIKSCPFCGELPKVETRNPVPHAPTLFPAFVRISCGKMLALDGHFAQAQGLTKDAAIEQWNQSKQ